MKNPTVLFPGYPVIMDVHNSIVALSDIEVFYHSLLLTLHESSTKSIPLPPSSSVTFALIRTSSSCLGVDGGMYGYGDVGVHCARSNK